MRIIGAPATDDAQAIVTGILMILGVVFFATTMYIAVVVPIETKKCEFQHADEVADDFAVLRASMKYLMHAESSIASTSVPVKMSPIEESIFSLPLSAGSLSFNPDGECITVRVHEPGTTTSGTRWTMTNFTDNFTVVYGDVTVEGGDLKLTYPYSEGYIESNMSKYSGSIGYDTGSNNTCYYNISWNETRPSNTEIVMKVRTSMNGDMSNSTDWVVVENGQNLSSIFPTLNGHRYVQFRAELRTWDPSKTPVLINVSIDYSGFDGSLVSASGAITFTSNYKYLPDHNLSYEHGAVIKSQTAGGLVLYDFNISFNKSGGVPQINISLVNLTGNTVSGYRGATSISVRLFRRDYKLISDYYYYPNVSINISTEYPSVCSAWLNKTLRESDLTYDDYSPAAVNDGTVTVEFYGHGHGIQLYLEKTTVEVEIQQ